MNDTLRLGEGKNGVILYRLAPLGEMSSYG